MRQMLLRDIAVGFRAVRRTPALTIVAAVMLAIGIGGTTAMFSEVDAVFLKPLAVDRPEQLRQLTWTSRARSFAGPAFASYGDTIMRNGGTLTSWPFALYETVRDRSQGFSGVACS